MNVTDKTLCVFSITGPSYAPHIYNFAEDAEAAAAVLIQANTRKKESIELWRERANAPGATHEAVKMAEGYSLQAQNENWQVGTFEEFEAAQRKALIKDIHEISRADFWEALECLPPVNWGDYEGGFNMFFMSERWTGTYTTQYARKDGRHFSAMVDLADKSTWINARMMAGEKPIKTN